MELDTKHRISQKYHQQFTDYHHQEWFTLLMPHHISSTKSLWPRKISSLDKRYIVSLLVICIKIIGYLAVLWLDPANAYGSILHKLVGETLKRYNVSIKISKLILGYYDNFQVRTCSGMIISDWNWHEWGIIISCTLSTTLFTLAINIIMKSAEIECGGPMMKTRERKPPIRAYMDDLSVTTKLVMRSW